MMYHKDTATEVPPCVILAWWCFGSKAGLKYNTKASASDYRFSAASLNNNNNNNKNVLHSQNGATVPPFKAVQKKLHSANPI